MVFCWHRDAKKAAPAIPGGYMETTLFLGGYSNQTSDDFKLQTAGVQQKKLSKMVKLPKVVTIVPHIFSNRMPCINPLIYFATCELKWNYLGTLFGTLDFVR